MRIKFDDFRLKINRFAPPSVTTTHLNELDEDARVHSYGFNKGGETALSVRNFEFTIHPLNTDTPLLHLGDAKFSGYFYLVGLHPSSPNVPEVVSKVIPMATFEYPSRHATSQSDDLCGGERVGWLEWLPNHNHTKPHTTQQN